jgi:hypothetical protein
MNKTLKYKSQALKFRHVKSVGTRPQNSLGAVEGQKTAIQLGCSPNDALQQVLHTMNLGRR